MATYREIQVWVKKQYGFVPKTCWIAHVLSDHNLTTRQASNRMNGSLRRYPCPVEKRPAIMAALKHFKMPISSN
jgi:hypothetical protein